MWPRSGFPHILRSLCLPLLSILKRWERVFVSAWVLSVCILQKNLRLCSRFCFCLLICLLASGIKPVFAQQYLTMTVSGAGAPVEYANGYYSYWDDLNGRPMYTGNTAEGVWCDIYWSGNLWAIDCDTVNLEFYSNENVASPEQVTLWHDGGYGASSMPSIVASSWDEPTLTPTFHPLFPTQTPRPPGDYTCPGYQPIGAGTVTPAADWLLKCAQCITPIPRYTWPTAPVQPTIDWEFQSTPTPVITPGTPTPTPTNNYKLYRTIEGTSGYLYFNPLIKYSINLSGYNYIWIKELSIGDPTLVKFGVHQKGSVHLTSSTESGFFNLTFHAGDYIDSQTGMNIEIVESNLTSMPVGTIYHLTGQTSYLKTILAIPTNNTQGTKEWEIKFNVTIPNGTASKTDFEEYFEWRGAANSVSGYVETTWYPGGVPIIPPPITSDCSTIPTAVPDDPDAPFKLPYIGVGEGQGISLGGWTIPTGWLQIFFPNAPDSFTLPGIELLFLPVEFGSLNLFGIPIDLDAMAFLMAGVVLIRILRS